MKWNVQWNSSNRKPWLTKIPSKPNKIIPIMLYCLCYETFQHMRVKKQRTIDDQFPNAIKRVYISAIKIQPSLSSPQSLFNLIPSLFLVQYSVKHFLFAPALVDFHYHSPIGNITKALPKKCVGNSSVECNGKCVTLLCQTAQVYLWQVNNSWRH